jgi:hypothetical protein
MAVTGWIMAAGDDRGAGRAVCLDGLRAAGGPAALGACCGPDGCHGAACGPYDACQRDVGDIRGYVARTAASDGIRASAPAVCRDAGRIPDEGPRGAGLTSTSKRRLPPFLLVASCSFDACLKAEDSITSGSAPPRSGARRKQSCRWLYVRLKR